jgi:hypothetical protein
LVVIAVAINCVGLGQFGGKPQVTFAIHPAAFMTLSLLNRKVKAPLESDDVNGPGIVVPQKPPASPPGTFPAGFVLEICGEVIAFPLKTYNASQLASISKAEKVTVTFSPGFVGKMAWISPTISLRLLIY